MNSHRAKGVLAYSCPYHCGGWWRCEGEDIICFFSDERGARGAGTGHHPSHHTVEPGMVIMSAPSDARVRREVLIHILIDKHVCVQVDA
jgi:hypothetical protein